MNFHNEPKISIQDLSTLLGISRQAIHARLKKSNLECKKSGQIGYLTHNITKKLFNFTFPQINIAVQHIKGGVGKTTTTDTEGDFFSSLGAKLLKIDSDFQKNLTSRYAISKTQVDNMPVLIDLVNGNGSIKDSIIQVSEGVDLLPSRFENATIDSALSSPNIDLSTVFLKIFEPIRQNYDIIIFDCPAMLGKLVTAITLYSDLILCPINPERYSIEGLETLQTELKRISQSYDRNINYKVFLNKFESSTKLSNDNTVINVLEHEINSGNGYDQAIIKSQEIINALQNGQNVFSYVKKSDVRSDFADLGKQVLGWNDSNNFITNK